MLIAILDSIPKTGILATFLCGWRKVADSRGDFAAPEGPGNSAEFAIREKIKAFELGDASEQ